jgi:antitoxin MazE
MYTRQEANVEAKIQKWGNSLGLRIPKPFADEIGIRTGSAVDLSLEEGRLVVRARAATDLRLDEMLAEVTAENLHDEIVTGRPRGREAW